MNFLFSRQNTKYPKLFLHLISVSNVSKSAAHITRSSSEVWNPNKLSNEPYEIDWIKFSLAIKIS